MNIEFHKFDIVSNYVLIAYKGDIDKCGNYRRFTVSLHRNYTFSYSFTNGDPLTKKEIIIYNNEIQNAQNRLTRERQYYMRGKNLGIWDMQAYNRAPAGTASIQDKDTQYYRPGTTESTPSPSINRKSNLDSTTPPSTINCTPCAPTINNSGMTESVKSSTKNDKPIIVTTFD
jgi:hypothetical protein